MSQRLAAFLVRQRLLTNLQAAQLLRGRFRGFFITDKYKILELLGAGGMGKVFLCEHLILQRLVAVKVLTGAIGGAASQPGAVERFYREARAVAILDHQNIVRVFDVDSANGQPYMVMEYVDGTDLHRVTTALGRMQLPHAVDYIRQAATGLQHAHQAGLVHRDIKPGNMLVDRSGVVKILDLGLARFQENTQRNENLTAKYDENAILGTADFISPEQINHTSDVDIRSDIYSLGCSFHFLLAGRSLFDEGSATQKLIWHQSRTPTPITQIRPEVPSGLGEVLKKMIAKRPEDRFQTPAEVVAALLPFSQGPVLPPPPELLPKASAASYRLGLSPSAPPGSSIFLRPSSNDNPEAGPMTGRKRRPPPLDQSTPHSVTEFPTNQMGPAPPMPPMPPSLPYQSGLAVSISYPEHQPQSGTGTTGPLSGGLEARRIRPLVVGVLAGALITAGVVYYLIQPETPTIKNKGLLRSPDPNAGAPPGGSPKAPIEAIPVPINMKLTAGGSTFVRPMMDRWSDLYAKKTGVKISFEGVGSGKGITGLLDQKFEFCCTDTPIPSDTIAKQRQAGVEIRHIPLVMGAVVPVYNLPKVDRKKPLRFTGHVLALIFSGKVIRWDDPVIKAANPGIELPSLDITPIYRSDSSGTTAIWTDYLANVDLEWKKEIGSGTKVEFPVGKGGEKGTGVTELILNTPGAIGYLELSNASEDALAFGLVRNRDGKYIAPSLDSVTAAAKVRIKTLTVGTDLTFSMVDMEGGESYPIAGTSWAAVSYPVGKAPKQEVIDFLDWATHEGQAHTHELKYSQIPDGLRRLVGGQLDEWKRKGR